MKSATEFKPMRGFNSASKAYNAGLREVSGDVVVFAHQDVYFPEGWDAQLFRSVQYLEEHSVNWAVLGVMGISRKGVPKGHLYCTGLQRVVGTQFAEPIECTTLDEVVLVVRRSCGIGFDERLPGFHLYGTDICYIARAAGFSSHIISAFCLHNTSGLTFLPWDFWLGYFYLRKKWSAQLPIRTPCTKITRIPFHFFDHPLRSFYSRFLKGLRPGQRVGDPSQLCREIVARKGVSIGFP